MHTEQCTVNTSSREHSTLYNVHCTLRHDTKHRTLYTTPWHKTPNTEHYAMTLDAVHCKLRHDTKHYKVPPDIKYCTALTCKTFNFTIHTVCKVLHTKITDYTLNTAHCKIHTVHYIRYTTLWSLYNIHYTLYTTHCRLYITHCTQDTTKVDV